MTRRQTERAAQPQVCATGLDGTRRKQRQSFAVPRDGRPGGHADDGVAGCEEDRRSTDIPRLGTAPHVRGQLDHVDGDASVSTRGKVGGDLGVDASALGWTEVVIQSRADDRMGEAVPLTGWLEDAGPLEQVERCVHRSQVQPGDLGHEGELIDTQLRERRTDPGHGPSRVAEAEHAVQDGDRRRRRHRQVRRTRKIGDTVPHPDHLVVAQ